MSTHNYDVTVSREDRWWMITVPAIDGLTQARRLGEVEQMARELIAVTTDVKISEVTVTVHLSEVAGVPAFAQRVEHIEHHRREAARLEADVIQQSRTLARDLVAAKVPLRDAAEVLGVSYQRVHQLANEDQLSNA